MWTVSKNIRERTGADAIKFELIERAILSSKYRKACVFDEISSDVLIYVSTFLKFRVIHLVKSCWTMCVIQENGGK